MALWKLFCVQILIMTYRYQIGTTVHLGRHAWSWLPLQTTKYKHSLASCTWPSCSFTLSLSGMNPSTLIALPSMAETLVWSLWKLLTINPIFFMKFLPAIVIKALYQGSCCPLLSSWSQMWLGSWQLWHCCYWCPCQCCGVSLPPPWVRCGWMKSSVWICWFLGTIWCSSPDGISWWQCDAGGWCFSPACCSPPGPL